MYKNAKRTLRRKLTRKPIWGKAWFYFGLLLILIFLAVSLYQIPAIKQHTYYYVATIRARIFYFFNPPADVIFSPVQQGTLDSKVASTLTHLAPTATQTPTVAPTAEFTLTPTITPLPTQTPTPLPKKVELEGYREELQGFNNCGPANLSMALSFWGWKGDQHVTEKVLKPNIYDRNVMPYEMLDYVEKQTELKGLVRYGGNIEMLKKFVAAGFPVIIERGYIDRHEGWMGHYGLVTGYDDATQEVIIPDTYLGKIKMSYEDVALYWAHFDDIYLVIYPPEREQEVLDILGPHLDSTYNKQQALEQVTARLYQVKDRELFFAWYSRGSIMLEMQDYYGASISFDEAFKIYEALPESERPWRITWYQTGPMFAYYYTGRYHDVYNLAKQTLDKTPEDAIPETWVWLGRAAVMLGDRDEAIYAFKQALFWHPNWWVAENELISLGEELD